MNYIIYVILGLLIGFAMFLIIALSKDFFVYRESRYLIMQNRIGFYTDKIDKEENGCVYFIENRTKKQVKVCGNYSIEEHA